MAPVKLSRSEKARQTRGRMREAAHALFVEQGYAATTMDQIAAAAGVAVQTLYYTFKTKGLLLAEVVDVTAAGEDDPAPVMERAWAREAMATSSAQRALALGVEHGTAIYDRVAHLWPAVGAAAAADASVADYWRGVVAGRRAGQGALIGRVADLGALRAGLDLGHAVDIAVVLLGHDVYRGLVIESGWTPTAYRAWLFATLIEQLLAVAPDAQAATGTSFAAGGIFDS